MMRIVHVHDLEGVGVPQMNIRLLLKALEKLRYIVRKRVKYIRGLIVHLTEQGRALIKGMMASLVDSRVIDNELSDMVEADDAALPAFDKLLKFFRNVHDDPAPFDHPWRCGQLHVGWPARFFLPPIPWSMRPA
jgi:hypothetical protein